MIYRVFKKDPAGVLHFDTFSAALGDGPYELGIIEHAHQLTVGDVLFINSHWRVRTPEGWHYLEALDSSEHQYADGPWSQAMIARLFAESSHVEEVQ